MYVGGLEAIPPVVPEDRELEDLQWVAPRELHRKWQRLEVRIAPPLIPILEELASAGEADFAEIAARVARVNDEMEADGPRIEFVPDVLMIPLQTPTLPPATHTNCYLVGSRDFLIVDPGSADPGEVARLLRHVARRRSSGPEPRAVVLTHHHEDHVGGAVAVASKLGIPVMAHAATWERWEDGGTLTTEGLVRELGDADVVSLAGGERLRVLHTPGHAEGHVALHDEAGGNLFAGDLVSGISTILVDTASGNLDRYLASLTRIRDTGAQTLFPAHGPPLMSPASDIQRVLDHRGERESKIVDALRDGPKPVDEVARIAYADTPGAAPALALSQATSHLDRLVRMGRGRRDGELWSLVP
jgi:glyoxylase-like metal-dependent hydrolase (beta-lactamase superfamily II)